MTALGYCDTCKETIDIDTHEHPTIDVRKFISKCPKPFFSNQNNENLIDHIGYTDNNLQPSSLKLERTPNKTIITFEYDN